MHKKPTQQATPFHEKELLLQARVGRREQLAKYAPKAILPYLTEQHRDFYAALPFIVIGSVDESGQPWATLLAGHVGFMHSPTSTKLSIEQLPNSNDPLASAIQVGAPLGLLGIEMSTRRRNRLNAYISQKNDTGFSLTVAHAYGNCPKFINTRALTFIREPDNQNPPLETLKYTEFTDEQREAIRQADTFFVSSYAFNTDNSDADGVDVSHRGGLPGFINIEGNQLTIPDYAGNNIFNTLGNFLHTPKAGLVFPDFATGDLMMLTGTIEILWEDAPEVRELQSAKRSWRFTLTEGITLKDALPFRATLNEYSPFCIKEAK